MQKRINEKPIRKVRWIELDKDTLNNSKRTEIGDIDDLIFGDERSVPSSR